MEELNTILAELGEQGALDSTGVFTLNLQRAAENLSAYRLLNPGLFVLNLVAAAVCGGASRLTVDSRDNEAVLWCDLQAELRSEQLAQLFSYILQPGAPAYLRELAVAVHAARELPDNPTITLLVSDTQQGHEVLVNGDDLQLSRGRPGTPGLTLRLQYAERRGWRRLLGQKLGPGKSSRRKGRAADLAEHLFHFCRFAPLNISHGEMAKGLLVTAGAEEKSVFAWCYLKGSQGMMGQPPEPRSGLSISPQKKSPVASTMMLSLSERSSTEGLLLISRGVIFRRPVSVLGFPLAHAVVTADHLEKNLSQSDLVEGPEYEALLEAVRNEVEQLVMEVCLSFPSSMSAQATKALGEALDTRYPLEAPIPVENFRHLQKVNQLSLTRQGKEAQMRFWRRWKDKDEVAASDFREALLEIYRLRTTAELADERWSDATDTLNARWELERTPTFALRAAAMFLADRESEADDFLRRAVVETAPDLAFLIGWSDLPPDSPVGRFLRFQRALSTGHLRLADRLAQDWERSNSTSLLLDVWLGWYAISRQRHFATMDLWRRTVLRVPPEDRSAWSEFLQADLEQRVSKPGQNLRHDAMETRQHCVSSKIDLSRLRWARQFWLLQLEGQAQQANAVFVREMLSALVDPRGARLLPVAKARRGYRFFT